MKQYATKHKMMKQFSNETLGTKCNTMNL